MNDDPKKWEPGYEICGVRNGFVAAHIIYMTWDQYLLL